MTVDRKKLGAGLLVAGGLLWFMFRRRDDADAGTGSGAGSASMAYPSYVTGRKVTNSPAGTDGFVRATPAALAAQAGVGTAAYTLSRFLGSEAGSRPLAEKAAIGWTIWNKAGRDPGRLLTLATRVSGQDTGLYGMQGMPDGRNRYASTRQDPTDRDVYVASMIMSGNWSDLSRGADQFYNPSAQLAAHRRWSACMTSRYGTNTATWPSLNTGCGARNQHPDVIVANWTSGGSREAYSIPEVPADKLILFRDRPAVAGLRGLSSVSVVGYQIGRA